MLFRSIVNRPEKQLEHPRQVGVVDNLATDKGELLADAGRESGEVRADPVIHRVDQGVFAEAFKETAGE